MCSKRAELLSLVAAGRVPFLLYLHIRQISSRLVWMALANGVCIWLLKPHLITYSPVTTSLFRPICGEYLSFSCEVRTQFSSNTRLFAFKTGETDLLERPTFDKSQLELNPEPEEGGDIGWMRHRRGPAGGDSYRVLLIDDERHTENLVVKIVPEVVPSVTVDEARKLFVESRKRGVAIVTIALKEHAEFYAQMMVQRGLRAAIEPDSAAN